MSSLTAAAAAADELAAAPEDLAHRTARSALVSVLGTGAKLALRLASIGVLARLLRPADFGLVAMVTVLTGFLSLFRDAGLCLATVQRDVVTRQQVSTLFWINLGVGLLLAGVTVALAPVLVLFYDEPRLLWIAVAVGIGFVFTGAAAQHQALLARRMRFTSLVAIELVSLAVGAVVGIGMAVLGWDYWALVGMAVSVPVAAAVGSWVALPWLPGLPSRGSGIRRMLQVGGAWSLIHLIVYVSYNIEKLLLGRYWGAEALGLYGRAYQLINLPAEQLTGAVSPVMISMLSRLQHQPERLRAAFMKGYSSSIALTVPVTLAGALLAEEITLIALGPQWLDAAPILRLLAPMALVFSLINPLSWFLVATARTRRSIGIALLIPVVMICGVVAGMPYGPGGVALAYSASLLVLTAPVIAWATWRTAISSMDIVGAIKGPFFSAMAATAAGLPVNLLVDPMAPVPEVLITGAVVLGVYSWMLLIVMGQKDQYASLLGRTLLCAQPGAASGGVGAIRP